jgi:Protein of unknown function (DUF3606)
VEARFSVCSRPAALNDLIAARASFKSGPDMIRDRDRINAHEDYELRYLDKELGVTPEKLKQTVEEVDLLVRDVRKALGN